MAPISDIQRETFTEIYNTYSGKLYGVCLHYVRDHDIACDLLHDSFVVIFSALNQLRDQSRLEAWMCSIVRNIALKHLRKCQKMPEISLDDINEPCIEETGMNVSEITLDELLKVVDDLPEQYGKVFRLSVLDGLSHNEIAEVLGIAPHSSSSNLSRAKQLLRKAVAKNWGIILTFCICAVAILYNVKDMETDEMAVCNTRVILIPAGQAEVMTASLASARTLLQLSYRAEKVPSEVCDATPSEKTEETVILTSEEQKPSPSETGTMETFDSFDTFEDWNEDKSAGKLTYGFSGTFSRTATGTGPGNSITSSPGISITPPGPGGNIGNTADGTDGTDGITPPATGEPVKPDSGSGDITQTQVKRYRHAMPVTFTASARYSFTDRWSISGGLQYTYLHSDITENCRTYAQNIHYLGIPLKASWTFWKAPVVEAYTSIGTTVELPVACRVDGKSKNLPCQWSAGIGFGLQYNISRHFGIYIEPELNWYFENGSSIMTIRSERPQNIMIPVGIRFSW